MPKDSDLESFYPEAYWWADKKDTHSSMAGILRSVERIYRETVLLDHVCFLQRCARKNAPEEKTLLDIGCGSGTFLSLAEERGFSCHGMDVSESAAAAARRQYGLAVRQGRIGNLDWDGLKFDFVTMFHVLEHLRNPEESLKYVASLLKARGSLIIQVPNAESLQARIFGRRWYGLDVPRHLINYTPKALQTVLDRCGLKICAAARFSLRDNPASIASSLVPFWDPMARKSRAAREFPLLDAVLESAYFGVTLLALPWALLESALGFGGTLWVEAKRSG
jgi:2-polyprenyl-3-methyl-5-hydroxy-6-metoxy-1,4-benzoquinol methylase